MGAGANSAASVGTGGMATKLAAAQIATQAGCDMVIMNGEAASPLSRLAAGERFTLFTASTNPKKARAQWIEIARGLVNYNHQNTAVILGHKSHEIERLLGYTNGAALIHRDNLVMKTQT